MNGLCMMLAGRAKEADVTFMGILAFRRTSAMAFLAAAGYPGLADLHGSGV